MKKLFEFLPSAERKFSPQLTDGHKDFVESACSWGLWVKDAVEELVNSKLVKGK